MSDRLVPEDERAARLRLFQIVGPVAAAHAAELDAEEPAVGRQVRLLERTHLGAPDVVGDRCSDLVHSRFPISWPFAPRKRGPSFALLEPAPWACHEA